MKTSKFTVGVDFQSAVQSSKSGVGYYTKGMVSALATHYPELEIYVHYYSFLNRAPVEIPNLPNVHPVKSSLLHPKLVHALRRISIELPFGLLLKRTCDAYFFPSFINHPVSKKATAITTIHDLAYLELPESVSKRNREDLTKHVPRYIARSTRIATVSNHARLRITARYPYAPDVFVTYSPPSQMETEEYSKTATTPDGSYILFVGNLEPRKNLVRLLEAYELLDTKLQNVYSLVIVGGNGWNNQEITTEIKRLQSQGLQIIVTGYVSEEELASFYKHATLFAFPSLYEGYGIPPLEAMAFGVPVLAADIEVLREVCQDAAVYCDPLDIHSISEKMTLLLTDRKLRTKVEQSGRKRLGQITWQKAAKILHKNLTASKRS